MLGLFSEHPIRWAHGRIPILKGGIGILQGGDEVQWITASARDGSAQDQEQQKAAVDSGNSGRQRDHER